MGHAMLTQEKEHREQLLKLINEALDQDKVLREKYQIGAKFRFIRDRLQAIQTRLQAELQDVHAEIKADTKAIGDDETVVYVYLFNAQGLVLQTWQKMLNPAVYYEYSINRPIYLSKENIESFIKQKPNKTQHGYLAIIIKKSDLIQAAPDAAQKDASGNPVVKIKEGSLRYEKLLSFTHNGQDYQVTPTGEAVKSKG